MLVAIRRCSMAKTSKKSKSPVKSAKRKVAIKDLKAKDAGSVKGGVISGLTEWKNLAGKDIGVNVRSFLK